MSPDPRDRLLGYYADVCEAAELIAQWVADGDREAFLRDRMRQAAVEREIEIIGEAGKRIRDILGEQHPRESDWYGAMKMRDFLAHRYDQVNPDVLWNAAKNDVPRILAARDCRAALGG